MCKTVWCVVKVWPFMEYNTGTWAEVLLSGLCMPPVINERESSSRNTAKKFNPVSKSLPAQWKENQPKCDLLLTQTHRGAFFGGAPIWLFIIFCQVSPHLFHLVRISVQVFKHDKFRIWIRIISNQIRISIDLLAGSESNMMCVTVLGWIVLCSTAFRHFFITVTEKWLKDHLDQSFTRSSSAFRALSPGFCLFFLLFNYVQCESKRQTHQKYQPRRVKKKKIVSTLLPLSAAVMTAWRLL